MRGGSAIHSINDDLPASELAKGAAASSSTSSQSARCRCWWPKWSWRTWAKLLASVVFAGALCGFSYWFSSSGYLAIFLEWVRDIGYWGNLLFVVAFTITGLPFMLIGYTPLGLAAGFIYGQEGPILGTPPLLSRMVLGDGCGRVGWPLAYHHFSYGGPHASGWWLCGAGILNASVTVLIGTITGSVLGFWSCRVLLKEWFQRKISESPTLQAFMQTMESKGFYLILIMRMAPIPFGVQNGLFSVRILTTRFESRQRIHCSSWHFGSWGLHRYQMYQCYPSQWRLLWAWCLRSSCLCTWALLWPISPP